jgi:riboflavin kinase/FMN adenylyltransferase
MDIITALKDFPQRDRPLALTVGFFDGVHRGHQAVLHELKKALPEGLHAVLSFKNHPRTILRKDETMDLLCTLPHRCKLFDETGVDALMLLEFTPELANLSFEEFVNTLRQTCPFTHLVLGHDATLGKGREGNKSKMQALATQMGFAIDYVTPLILEGTTVSSSVIRTAVRAGKLKEAEKYLGRPFSIYQTIQTGQGLGQRIGFPTLNIPVEGLCLPPLGVYAVHVKQGEDVWPGVANLGTAPTVRSDHKPLLEVHLLEGHVKENLPLEVIFRTYLRPEQRFASVEELKVQIGKDVENARKQDKTG